MDIRRKNKRNFLIVIAVLIFIMCANFAVKGNGEYAFALTKSKYCWGPYVNDKALNKKNGIPYGTGSGQLVCTTYVSWAVHNLYKVIGYPSGGIVTTHYNWLKNNAEHICTISKPSDYSKYKGKIKPGDIVVYNTGNNFSGIWVHVAIIGGDSKTLHHAISSGVGYKYSIGGWLGRAADVRKQASSCKVYRLLIPDTGKLHITKSAGKEAKFVSGLKNYSVEGAIYKVYKSKSKPAIHTFKINKKGSSKSWKVKSGTYYIKETKAPKHFRLDKKWYKVKVEPGKDNVFKGEDLPLLTKSGILLKKSSKNTGEALKSAVYEVKYYDNDNNKTNGKPVKSWKIKTDEKGYGNLSDSKYIISGSPFRNSKKEVVLPFGTYTYKEIEAPRGYQLDNKVYISTQSTDVKYNIKNVSDMKLAPKIETEAMDIGTKSKLLSKNKNTNVTDKVSYCNLEIGKNYTIKGQIIDKATNKILFLNGIPATSEKSFKPEKMDGEVQVDFKFDSRDIQGKTLVIFEELFLDGRKIAEHRDKMDVKQTIYSPALKTTAIGKKTSIKITELSDKSIIIDNVKYENLVPGKEYRIDGILMDKISGKPALNKNGRKILASKIFKADKSDGKVEIEFSIDSIDLEGRTLVAFEKCYYNDALISSHEDINSKEQTVKIPRIRTVAKSNYSNKNIAENDNTISIVDNVKYKNLISGKKYTISGCLVDKSNGKPLHNSKNELIKSEKTFLAKNSDGNVDIKFKVDRFLIENKTIVVFEDCYYENIKVATHSDINDKEQTLRFTTKKPKIEKTKNKSKIIDKKKNNTVETGDKSTLWKYSLLLILAQFALACIILSKFLKKSNQ